MAKTNFTKVEKDLDKGLEKMKVSNLHDLADIAAGIGESSAKKSKITETQHLLVQHLKIDLKRLRKKEKKLYSKLQIKKEVIDKQLSAPESLSEEEWKDLASLRKKTSELIAEYFPDESNEELIEQEKIKHRNKRFNVKDNWLPLQ
jgi:hypothetical protein